MTDIEAPATPDRAAPDAQVPAVAAPGAALGWAGTAGRRAASETLGRPEDEAEDLLDGLPHRSPFRASVIGPVLTVLAALGLYAGVTLLWPLTAVMPEAVSVPVAPMTAPAAAPAWPGQGSGAVAVEGFESTGESGTVASTADVTSTASITKLVTALMVLDRLPLAVGESGPSYTFTSRDRSDYFAYLSRGESALNVPVGESLSEYQMLQAILVGSANNYAARLADEFWPTDEVFASAASDWLTTHGISGVSVVEPTGIDIDNIATPAGVIALGRKALEHPVVAEIVRQPLVTLPGAGEIENTNGLLVDPGVVGIKTGTLETFRGDVYNLVAAKDIPVGAGTVRAFATALGQADDVARTEATRALLAQVEAELTTPYVTPAGTLVGTVQTAWGEMSDIRTDADADVILWNGASSSSTSNLTLADGWEAGAPAGTFTLSGPLGSETVAASVVTTIEGPSPWWRLTHPLQLFGLAD